MSAIKHVGVFTLLGLWTVGPPIAIQQAEDGGFEIAVGAGVGQGVDVTRSCSGELRSSTPVPQRTVAVAADYRVEGLHVSAFGGTAGADDSYSDAGGWFGGGMLAYDKGGFAAGVGYTHMPGPPGDGIGPGPSFYLRTAGRSSVHLLFDHAAPHPLYGTTGISRLGIGFPVGTSLAMVGLGAGRTIAGWDTGGPFLELDLGLGSRISLLTAASYFPGEADDEWGIGAGVRIRP